MKIVLAGGSGFLGSSLIASFKKQKAEIVLLTRHINKQLAGVQQVIWDGRDAGAWCSALEGADAVINLCGKSVDCRYTEENKTRIYTSRLLPTRAIGLAIQKCTRPPRVWINASSATIYRAAYEKKMDEFSGEIGDDFSESICKQWEQGVNSIHTPGTRKIILRISITLGRTDGALKPLKHLVRLGFGGHQGKGNQRVSWVHAEDFSRAVNWVIGNENAFGVYNVVAPETCSNREMMATLRKELHRPVGMNIPTWLLELGATVIRTETELVLKSRNVYPARLLDEGFTFLFPTLTGAIHDLCLHRE